MTRKQEIRIQIRDAIRPFFPAGTVKIVLFGSQANSPELQRADFDIGLISSESIPPSVLTTIREALEDLPVLYPIDLVEMSKMSTSFQRFALAHSETL
jgi:hypothetical protein